MNPPNHPQPQSSDAQRGHSVDGVYRLLTLRKYDQALSLCRHLLESAQESAELHRLAGMAALRLENLPTAKLHLEASLRLDPEDASTL